MSILGQMVLAASLISGLLGIAIGIAGLQRDKPQLLKLSVMLALAVVCLLTLAEVVLLKAILTDNRTLVYAATYSSSELPLIYKCASLWAGQAGSLMFWTWITSLYMVALLISSKTQSLSTAVRSMLVLLMILCSFLAILVMLTSPFAASAKPIISGSGMNPLLQNPWMAIHPPLLFLGYAGLAVPFALLTGTLWWGKRSPVQAINQSRSWLLIGWTFLTLGIIVGAFWAYLELGWGGYWAWDPVENASLIPWLISTALIHMIILKGKKQMFSVTTIILAAATFALVIFGTFLTRSGIVASVHAFAQDKRLGLALLGIIIGILSLTIIGIIKQRGALKAEGQFESLTGKEFGLLSGAIIFLLLTVVVFLGTTLPIWTSGISKNQLSVGEDFYNRTTVPFFFGMLVLMGLVPMLKWTKTPRTIIKRRLLIPVLTGMLVSVGAALFGVRPATLSIAFGVGTSAIVSVIMHSRSLHSRQQFGALLAHLAMIFIFVGVIASSYYKQELDAALMLGESVKIGPYILSYQKLDFFQENNARIMEATVLVQRNGQDLGVLNPQRRFYTPADIVISETARRPTLLHDLYIVLAGTGRQNLGIFKVHVNPMVGWIWWSSFFLVPGMILILWPCRKPVVSAEKSTVGETAHAI